MSRIHWLRYSGGVRVPWRLFHKPPADLAALIDVYTKSNSVEFDSHEAEVTDLMVRRALRAARWRHRLKIGRLVWQASQRRWIQFYARSLKPRYLLLVSRLHKVAEREEAKQEREKPVPKDHDE